MAVLQATPEEIQRWQEQDPTLQAAREAVGQELSGGVQFYRREGLLYRHWHPRDQTEDGVQACEQLVLPESCCHQKPFQRIAMDLVGPLPRSKNGNRFILTICDYATRQSPLPSTEAPRIEKELLKIFIQVGISEEVPTDQSANFMSGLLGEIYRILQIKRIHTTPYHPQTGWVGREIQWNSQIHDQEVHKEEQ